MRITAFMIMVFCMHAYSSSFGQSQEITLVMNSSVREVIEQLEKVTEYRFVVKSNETILDKKVNVKFKNQSIEKVLDNLLKDSDYNYKIVDKYIAISPKSENAGKTDAEQKKEVSGKVTDADGNSLPGVNIVEKGTTNGVVTDLNGSYTFFFTSEDAVLEFSYVGFLKQEILVKNQTNIDVVMIEDITSLEDVLVVGYGTQKKRDITGSIASVKGDQLSKASFSDVRQSLQGQTAGVYVVSNSGKPGAGTSVRIRGIGGINNSEPLYIIDGIQGADISSINSNDIESIEILKDASSAAIYGARGANGVVLVTTKGGGKNGVTVGYNGSFGWQNIINIGDVNLLNGQQFAEVYNQGFINDNRERPYGGKLTFLYPREFFPDPSELGAGTNWWDVMTVNNAPVQEHSISIGGGNEKQKMYSSFSYYDQVGNVVNTGFSRYSFRINSDHKVTDWLTAGNNTSISWSTTEGMGENGRFADVWSALVYNPLIDLYKEDGSFAGPPHPHYGKSRNPYAISENTNKISKDARIENNIYLGITLFKDLTFKSNLAFRMLSGSGDSFYNGIFEEGIAKGSNTSVAYDITKNFNYQWSNILNYSKEIKGHKISVLGGYEVQYFENEIMSGGATYVDPTLKIVNTNLSEIAQARNIKISGSMISYFGSLNYNYNDKYYITGNIRRDGSSKFGANTRFGVFPSVSGAWRVSGENFFPETVISDLKLRASFGEVGNDKIGDFKYIAPLREAKYAMSGANGAYQIGNIYAEAANPDLRWEFSKQTNFGIDLGMFENRLNVTADYFVTYVEDMLLGIKIPTVTGIAGISRTAPNPNYKSIVTNAGALTNKGFEFDIKYKNQISSLTYSLGANFTTYNNEVTDIGDNEYIGSRTYVGGSLGDFFGYIEDGIFQTQEEVDAANELGEEPNIPYQFDGTSPGDYRYKDITGDGKVSDEDRTIIGSPIPDFTYGVNVTLDYKGFSLYALFFGTYGNDLYNNVRSDLESTGTNLNNSSTRVLSAWTETGSSNTIARRSSLNANNIGGRTSTFIEDGSYLRLRTIQLSYTLPKTWVQRLYMKNLKIFVAGDNLITFSDYLGFDPEVSNQDNLSAGLDAAFYPHAKTMRMGVNINF